MPPVLRLTLQASKQTNKQKSKQAAPLVSDSKLVTLCTFPFAHAELANNIPILQESHIYPSLLFSF